MKKLVIIPAYNEEKNITGVINRIKSIDKDLDIIVVDDGSADNTSFFARNMGATILRLPFNMGYGIALQTGYKYAYENDYEVMVQMDADGQHDPKYIPAMINELINDNTDFIIGSRFKLETGYKTSILRRSAIKFFSLIVSAILKKRITDPTSGYQAMKSCVLPFLISEIFPNDYPDADFLIMLHYEGFRIEEFPMQMRSDPKSKSMHNGMLKNIYYIFKMLMSIFLLVIGVKIFNNRRIKCH